MASLPAQIGARSIYRTYYPFKAISNAIETGTLPKLDQSKAPAGYDLVYSMGAIGPQASVADATAKIQALGGLPIELAKEPEPELPWWKQALSALSGLVGFTSIGGAFGAVVGGAQYVEPVDPYVGKRIGTAAYVNPGGTMSFQDGDSWSFGDIFSGVNQALQGGLGQQLLNIGGNALTSYINTLAPQPVVGYSGAVATPAMAAVPAIAGAGRAVATVGRGFFNRFPNLATAIQSLRNRGANISRSSLYSAMRRFGPEMLVSGGLLTAAAVSELAVAGPGRRRMNPGNVKALRRAHRRLKSFHNLCVDNDSLLRRRRASPKPCNK